MRQAPANSSMKEKQVNKQIEDQHYIIKYYNPIGNKIIIKYSNNNNNHNNK
jgi:hypothetical protein